LPTPNDDKLLRMDGWPGGVNNRIRETEQASDRGTDSIPNSAFLRRALNVDLTTEGHPLRRRGYALAQAGYAHSVFNGNGLFFVVIDGALMVGPKSSELVQVATVNKYLRMSYTTHAGAVYYSNGVDSGRYTTTLEVWPGPDQEYDIHTDEDLELADNLYETMPIGHVIASNNGRMWVGTRDTLWFSEGMSPHICRRSTNYFMLPSYPYMLQPSGDGMYIGTETGISFLKGADPFTAELEGAYSYGIVPFAFTRVPGRRFEVEEDDVPVWWTRDGVMSVGLPSGEVRQLTRDRLAAPEYGFGAMSLREREGISQVVSSLQKGGDANNMGASDSVVAEIRRC